MIKHEEARPDSEKPPLFVVTPRVIAARRHDATYAGCTYCALNGHECGGGERYQRAVNCFGVYFEKFPLPSDDLKILQSKAILANKRYMVLE